MASALGFDHGFPWLDPPRSPPPRAAMRSIYCCYVARASGNGHRVLGGKCTTLPTSCAPDGVSDLLRRAELTLPIHPGMAVPIDPGMGRSGALVRFLLNRKSATNHGRSDAALAVDFEITDTICADRLTNSMNSASANRTADRAGAHPASPVGRCAGRWYGKRDLF